MTVIFDRGDEAPEGPIVPAQGAAVEGDDDAPIMAALAAMAEAALISVRPGGDPEGEVAARAARSAMDVAGAMLVETAVDMARLRRRLQAEDVTAVADAVKLARDLRAGAALMIEERNRLDKLRKEAAGGVGGTGTLDLAAARDEIGRRLACLRRAG